MFVILCLDVVKVNVYILVAVIALMLPLHSQYHPYFVQNRLKVTISAQIDIKVLQIILSLTNYSANSLLITRHLKRLLIVCSVTLLSLLIIFYFDEV